MQYTIAELMEEIGISETEVGIYTTLLKDGPLTMAEIASGASVPRTTCIENIKRLIKKGLVSQTVMRSRKQYIAEEPEKIRTIMYHKQVEAESRVKKLNELRNDLPNFLSLLSDKSKEGRKKSKFPIKYYEDSNGFLDVCERSLTNSTQEILFISNMDEWKKVFTDEYAYQYYVPKRLQKKLFAKTLAIKSPLAANIRSSDSELMREMRFLPEGYDFKPTIIINDNEVSIMTSSDPYNAILIEDSDITKLFRDVFNNLWTSAN